MSLLEKLNIHTTDTNETGLSSNSSLNTERFYRKNGIPTDCIRHIEIDDDVEALTQTYIKEKALGKASENDAYHIALASVNRLDCLVSWNFKHIVNFDKIKMFNSINIRLGYPVIDIRSPLEFLKNEN